MHCCSAPHWDNTVFTVIVTTDSISQSAANGCEEKAAALLRTSEYPSNDLSNVSYSDTNTESIFCHLSVLCNNKHASFFLLCSSIWLICDFMYV